MKLAGLMYSVDTAVEPVGFVGTNDVWHGHTGLCIVISDKGITTALSDETNMTVKERQCPLVGGRYIKQTGWMMHVWVAPGYENPPGGYFAEENPLIACSDGTYYTASRGGTSRSASRQRLQVRRSRTALRRNTRRDHQELRAVANRQGRGRKGAMALHRGVTLLAP